MIRSVLAIPGPRYVMCTGAEQPVRGQATVRLSQFSSQFCCLLVVQVQVQLTSCASCASCLLVGQGLCLLLACYPVWEVGALIPVVSTSSYKAEPMTHISPGMTTWEAEETVLP